MVNRGEPLPANLFFNKALGLCLGALAAHPATSPVATAMTTAFQLRRRGLVALSRGEQHQQIYFAGGYSTGSASNTRFSLKYEQ